jgi:hypothetical protein
MTVNLSSAAILVGSVGLDLHRARHQRKTFVGRDRDAWRRADHARRSRNLGNNAWRSARHFNHRYRVRQRLLAHQRDAVFQHHLAVIGGNRDLGHGCGVDQRRE